MRPKRPPPYPAPITPPEQRAAAREVREEMARLNSPLVRSRGAMDGPSGLAWILGLAAFLLLCDVLYLSRFGIPQTWEEGVPLIALNVAVLAFIGWGVHVRRAHRRWRRLAQGRCAECGYSLEGLTSDRCPECGAPALRMRV
jgi:hypothetical protein